MAAEETVKVVQSLTVELEVYVSGYPEPAESNIMWKRPDQSVIMSSDPGVSFQEGRKRMILSNVQADQAGLYECTVTVQAMSASVKILLNVYGEQQLLFILKALLAKIGRLVSKLYWIGIWLASIVTRCTLGITIVP